jgi:hypothetical protein
LSIKNIVLNQCISFLPLLWRDCDAQVGVRQQRFSVCFHWRNERCEPLKNGQDDAAAAGLFCPLEAA